MFKPAKTITQMIMTSKVALLLTLFYLQISCAQTPFGSPAKTADHKNITGTAVWIIPPPGFVLSSNFKGFVDSVTQIAAIMLTEMPGPYAEISKPFTSAMPLPNGLELKDKKEMTLWNRQAMLVHIEQTARGSIYEKQLLIVGDSTNTIMINGISLKDSVTISKAIKESLATVYYDDLQAINPRGVLDYTIDESGTKLKFSTVIGNSMLFSVDGKTPTRSADKTGFISDKSFAPVHDEDQKAFCINRIKQVYGSTAVINMDKGVNKVKIDGLTGYELFATTYRNGNTSEQLVYDVILFDEGNYFILVGLYEEDTKENVQLLKKVARTFKRK